MEMRKIYVTGKAGIKELQKKINHDYIVISIRSESGDYALWPQDEFMKDVLFLKFDDVDKGLTITDSDAKNIFDFVNKYTCGIVCQCEAGISRSSGLAAALSLYFNETDKHFFKPPYVPNMFVYRKILSIFVYGNVLSYLTNRR